MAAVDNFRSSLHGFNRTDVVQFIQQQTVTHDKAMRSLKEENTRLQEALTEARAELERLNAEKEALLVELEIARLAVLEAPTPVEESTIEEALVIEAPTEKAEEAPIVAPANSVVQAETPEIAEPKAVDFNELELAAYRRAEMTERLARERAAASAERMKTVFAQTDEKLVISAKDISVVYESFKNDYERLQQLLSDIRGIVGESSANIQAVTDLCTEI